MNLLFRRQSTILSAAFVIMVTYGLAHVMGLVKTRLLISYFFASQAQLLDVYYAAFVIPDTLFQLLVMGALSAAFIPVFTRYLTQDEGTAWRVASAALNLVLVVLVGLSAVVFVLAGPLSRLVAPGFNASQIGVMIQLLRIMLLAQALFCVSSFLTGIIQSHQRFLVPALAPVAYNLGIIAGIVFLSGRWGIFGPTWGVVIGAIGHVLIQLPVAWRLGWRPALVFTPHHPGVAEIIRLMPPRALALGIDQVEQLVAVTLASLLSAGSLSLLNVARLLFAIPASLFGVTIGQAALPALSRQAPDLPRFRQTLIDSFLQVVFLALPASVLLIVLRIPIVRLAFGARTFPWAATLLTGKTLAILAVSAAFAAAMQLVIRGFYALHDTRTPLVVGLLAAVFNTAAAIFSFKVLGWGILGLAVAISTTAILETLALAVILDRRTGQTGGRLIFLPLLKMVGISFVTGVGLWLPMRLLDKFVFDTTRTLPLIGLTVTTSLIGLSLYLLLSFVFRVEQLTTFVALAKRLGQWRKLLAAPPAEPLIVPAPDQN